VGQDSSSETGTTTTHPEVVLARSTPTDEDKNACTRFQRAVEFIGKRWVGVILFFLLAGPARFNEILAGIPNLSDRLLTERLRELEAAAMVTREVQPGPPVRVIYELTDAGRSLSDIIRAVAHWSNQWTLPATD
jgi:DNA-binding HxlR family transcriptional regulator